MKTNKKDFRFEEEWNANNYFKNKIVFEDDVIRISIEDNEMIIRIDFGEFVKQYKLHVFGWHSPETIIREKSKIDEVLEYAGVIEFDKDTELVSSDVCPEVLDWLERSFWEDVSYE